MLMKNVEEFTNCNANDVVCSKNINRCLPQTDLKQYSTDKYYNFRDVQETNPLTLMGCLRVEYSDNLLSKLSDICYTTHQEFDTTSDGAKYKIYEKVLEDLRKTKGSNELLLDPVYVIVYQDDNQEYEKPTRIIMIYPNHPKKNGAQSLRGFFNQYVYSAKSPECTATIYQINKDHKMFYDLIQKKVYATL